MNARRHRWSRARRSFRPTLDVLPVRIAPSGFTATPTPATQVSSPYDVLTDQPPLSMSFASPFAPANY
ncbi:MAG: hypothetical protein JOZ53_14190 [Planctomycetaceae bacterium]|nr:hypothetical protein [Planctomycetaceae bacterium]